MANEFQVLLGAVGFAALVVFVIDYFGNLLVFGNRFVNALVSAALLVAALAGSMAVRGISLDQEVPSLAIAGALMFVVGLAGNIIAFGSRLTNALVTALLFAVLFTGILYALGRLPGV